MGRYLIIGLLCIGVLGTSALGAGTNRGRSKQQLAKAWGSFYAGKYRDVVKLTDPLTKLRGLSAPIQREAMHLQARALWATGDKRSQSKGQRYWELLGKKSGGDVSSWMTISKALQAKNPNLESLEKIVRRKSSPVAAEAGIELAHQYVEAKRFDDAGELLKHLSALLKDKKTLTVMETTPAEVKPFADEIAAALGRLKYQRNEGLKEFEAAEKLRKKRRFPQAIKVYEKIVKEFDQTPFAPRSDLHIGDCWLGLKQTDRAKNQWDEFVTSSPAGPWRGQAYVKLIDLALSNLDLTEAARYVQLARTGAQAAASSTSVDVSDSWSKARFDLAFRSGVVQYANGNPKQAADAFQAAQAATSKQQAGNIQRLIDAATTGKPLIPEECTTDSPGKPETALSLAMMFHLINQNTQAETFLSKLPRIGTKPQQAFALFLQGSILQSQNKLANAKAEFEKAIKTAPAAIFHDETLYRLATIIEKESSRKYRRPKAPKTKPGEKTKPLTAKQLTAQRHAEQKTTSRVSEIHDRRCPLLAGDC